MHEIINSDAEYSALLRLDDEELHAGIAQCVQEESIAEIAYDSKDSGTKHLYFAGGTSFRLFKAAFSS